MEATLKVDSIGRFCFRGTFLEDWVGQVVEAFLAQSQEHFLVFLLTLVRVSAILVFAPIFGSVVVPVQAKVGLSLIIAAMLSLALPVPVSPVALGLGFLVAVGGEVLLGMAVGFTATLIFEAVQVAGEMAGVQMGFGIVNVIDPMTSARISLVGQFNFVLAVLLFLAVGGHRMIVEAIGQSLRVIPPGQLGLGSVVGQHFVDVFGEMLVIAVKLAAPILVSLLLASFAEGIIARTVPQINIFIVGFGIRIAFGLFVLMLSVGFFVVVMTRQFEDMSLRLEQVIRFFVP